MKGYIWISLAVVVLVGIVVFPFRCDVLPWLAGCDGGDGDPPPNTVPISMASSITKWEWLEAAAESFNEASKKDSNLQVNGERIIVEILLEEDPLNPGKFKHWLSPTQVYATARGAIHPTILSPAGSNWLMTLNEEWKDQGNSRPITTGPAPSLLSTPVVIAMWESRARALNCWPDPQTECTWTRIRELAVSPEGWGLVNHPEWKRFRFGYAYVGESDVATQTAILVCMSGLGKTVGLTLDDVTTDNDCGQAIGDVDKAVVHRGTSSPWLLKQIADGGPEYLDAITTYEKNVIGFNLNNQPREPLVSVYPQDGTVIADHPFAIMDGAPWVTPQQVEAARLFREYLLSEEQQKAFLPFGLRPSDPSVPLGSPIDLAHGANPNANLKIVTVPDPDVVELIIEVWKKVKKHASIVLVFDKSGSMGGNKMDQAVKGARAFVDEMDLEDELFWLPFDSGPYPGTKGTKREVGEQIKSDIIGTRADGPTALYDTIGFAYGALEDQRAQVGDTVRYGVVVLSDGQDTHSNLELARLLGKLQSSEEDPFGIQVHTIGIGDDADDRVLTKIAVNTHGRFWKVKDADSIEAVYRLISKYW